MIFVFSGTGNSLHAAQYVATRLGDRVFAIASERDLPAREYAFQAGDALGFVFPIHAWGVPAFVLDFIRDLKLAGPLPYTFAIATCGADTGNATAAIEKLLAKKGLALDGAFAVKMPDNYIIGFASASSDVQAAMRAAADLRLDVIARRIGVREKGARMLFKERGAVWKTALIHPLFNRFSITTKPFFVTDACIRCGLCARICPVHTIRLDPTPVWGKKCTQCLACINRCPVDAIEYGKSTAGRTRYVHPDLK